jgi:hypothetical protein
MIPNEQETMTKMVIDEYKWMRDQCGAAQKRVSYWRDSAILGWMFFFIGQLAWVIRSFT